MILYIHYVRRWYVSEDETLFMFKKKKKTKASSLDCEK